MINSLFKKVGKNGTLFTAHTHLGRQVKMNALLREAGKQFGLSRKEIKQNVSWEVGRDVQESSNGGRDNSSGNDTSSDTVNSTHPPATPKKTPGNTSVPGQRQAVTGSSVVKDRKEYDASGNELTPEQRDIRAQTANMLKSFVAINQAEKPVELSSLETEMTALKASREESNIQQQCNKAMLSINSTIGKLQGKVREGLAKYQDLSTGKFKDPKTFENATDRENAIKDQKDLMNLSRIIQNLTDVQADLAELYSANEKNLQERILQDPHKAIEDVARFKWDACQVMRAFEHATMEASDYEQLKKDFPGYVHPEYEQLKKDFPDYEQLKNDFINISNTLKSQIDDCIGENAQSPFLRKNVQKELTMHGEELANMKKLLDGQQYDRSGVNDTDVTPPNDIPSFE